MQWYELYNNENEPTNEQIVQYVKTPLWSEFNAYLQDKYAVKPQPHFSKCAMDGGIWKGWHIKYKKSSRALCTLYARDGHFAVNVVIPEKAELEADLLIQTCDEYTQNLYGELKYAMGGKWMVMEVTHESILDDVKRLIELRVNVK